MRGQAAIGLNGKPFNARTLRGQAAIEFLVTYGWAIFVLLIVVTFVLSSGMLSPSYFVSEECNIGPTLPCNFQLYKDGSDLKLIAGISNGFNYKIGIKSITFQMLDSENAFDVTTAMPLELESGQSQNINAVLKDIAPAAQSIKKINVQVVYYPCANEINPDCDPAKAEGYTISGKIIGRVSAK